jgi:hypothetical protein
MKKKSRKGIKFPHSTNKAPGKYTPKAFTRSTHASTGHKAYRTGTGDVMEGYFTSEVGAGNRNYINKMADGYQ